MARVLLASSALIALGCQPAEPVRLTGGHEPFPISGGALDPAPLSMVLSQWTGSAGDRRLDDPSRATLLRYLVTIERAGPETCPAAFPGREDRIAYYLNAAVAWTIALGSRPALFDRPAGPLGSVRVPLDGGVTSVDAVARKLAQIIPTDPRIGLFTIPEIVMGATPPDAAVSGYALEWQLRRQGERCGRQPGFWLLDAPSRTLAVSRVAALLPGLPSRPAERAQVLLRFVPPAPDLAGQIRAVCGDDLRRCRIESASAT